MDTLSQSNTASLREMTNKERLDAYNILLDGCHHLWSKGKPQEDKIKSVINLLAPLTQNDPYFLARLTSYVFKNSSSHDLKVMTTFANALSSADGTPFSPGSKYSKPNLRYISAAALQLMDPKDVKRLSDLWTLKFGVDNYFKESFHHTRQLRQAFQRYLKYRAVHFEMMRGIKKAGMANFLRDIYKVTKTPVPEEVAAVLRWKQKEYDVEFDKPLFDFTGLDDLGIAEKIRADRIPALAVFGGLAYVKKKISPVIAVALLEQTTGNQAVILRDVFEDAGVLADAEVFALYESKIREAKTALDRVDNISKTASEAVKQALKSARADVRKEQVGDIGKIYMMIDISGSMSNIVKFAADHASIIAECVQNPTENFRWGLFHSMGFELPLPTTFETDAFQALLFGVAAGGGTDIGALFPRARQLGSEIDVIVSDGDHNGNLRASLQSYMANNPSFKAPKACVFVDFGNVAVVKDAYEAIGTPVAVIKPSALTSSARVAESIKLAMKGPLQLVDDIMNTPLLELPKWYYTI